MIELPNATLVSVDGNEDAEEVFGKEISVHRTFEFLMGYIASLELFVQPRNSYPFLLFKRHFPRGEGQSRNLQRFKWCRKWGIQTK